MKSQLKKAASKTFDYIIVGSGSSGAVVANRLSENHTVCLLEAGPDSKTNPFVAIPLAVGFLVSYNPFSNWNYDTVPQKHLNNRSVFWPRGKMLGGSSAMNGMVYQRGHARDYDMWAELGNNGWSYNDMLPYFKKLECYEPQMDETKENEFHGFKGPVRVSDVPSPNPLAKIYVDSAHNAGLKLNSDFNGKDQEGVGLNQWTASGGLRCSTAAAYLSKDVRSRENLTILTNTKASRVILEGNTVTGVEISSENEKVVLNASKEVVLSGGALNSPQLLLLSGIGPKQELEKIGVKSKHDLPGVGKNMQDHLNLAVTCRESTNLSYGLSMSSIHRWIISPLQLALGGKGMLTSTFAEGGGFAKTRPEKDIPDIQFHFYPSKIKRQMELNSILGHGFSLQTCLLRPKSRGSVTLKDANPDSKVLIDPNYLAEEEDIQVFVDGFKLMRKILNTAPIRDHIKEEINPGKNAVQTDEDIRDFIRDNATTIFHPTGTCRMGPSEDREAVVDSKLRVHGIQGLRVVDASIMPEIVGANTNVPAIAIGERASSFILGVDETNNGDDDNAFVATAAL